MWDIIGGYRLKDGRSLSVDSSTFFRCRLCADDPAGRWNPFR